MVNNMRCVGALASMAVLAAVYSAADRADIAINTFGNSDSYDSQQNWAFGSLASNGRLAVRFVPSASATIDRVSAAMANGSAGTQTVTLSIQPEVSGVPGPTPIWTSGTLSVGTLSIYTFTGSSVALTAGQAYWVSAYAPSAPVGQVHWQFSSPGTSGSIASGPSPWSVVSTTLPALRVESMPTTGACCSTVTGGCAVLASSTCTLLGLRFDGAGSACGAVLCHACPADVNHSGTINAQDIFDYLNLWFAGCP